jgi:hypothetical protein
LPHAGLPLPSVRGVTGFSFVVGCVTMDGLAAGRFGSGPLSHAPTNATTANSFIVFNALSSMDQDGGASAALTRVKPS